MAAILVTFGYAAFADAYTQFHTQCTTPNETVNFVSSSPTRGTLDILWSCLFTIIACTWIVQHLNIPEQRDNRDSGISGDVKCAMKLAWTSSKWMLWTVLAPEILIGRNIGDWRSITLYEERFEKMAEEDRVPWSRTHSYFANMGGFVIRSYVPDRVEDIQTTSDISGLIPSIEAPKVLPSSNIERLVYEPNDGGKHSHTQLGATQQTTISASKLLYLTGLELCSLRGANVLKRLPYLTKEEINVRSKTDTLIRSLAILQILC